MYTLYPGHIVRQADGAIIPIDEANSDYQAFIDWCETNTPEAPSAPTFQERAAALLRAVDARLNSAAQAQGYDSIVTAALRAALPESVFHEEGLAFGNWMDATYATCYAAMAAVQAGELDEPTEADLIAMLPELVLPSEGP